VDAWLVAIVALLIGGAAAVLGIRSRRTLSTIATLAPKTAAVATAATAASLRAFW